MLKLSIFTITIFCLSSCHSQTNSKTDSMSEKKNPAYSRSDTNKVVMSEEEWKNVLPKDVYNIARQKGTERPWSSKFENFSEIGTYYCAACGNPLFKSD